MSLLNQYCFNKGNYYLNTAGPTKSPKKVWELSNFQAKSAPLIYDNVLYLCIDKCFIAIDPENGNTLWEYKIPGQATIPVFKTEHVFFGGYYSDNYVYCLNKNTGKEIWKYRTGSSHSGVQRNPLISKDSLILTAGKTIHVLDIVTGKKRWTLNLKKRIGYNTLVVTDEKAYAITYEGPNNLFLHCIDLDSRKELWKTKVSKPISDPIYINGDLYFLNCEGDLCFVDQQTGEISRTKIIKLKKEASHLFLVYHDGILLIVCDYYILARDLKSNTWLWHKHITGKIGKPIVNSSVVYFGSMRCGIFGLDIKTGKEKFNINTNVRSKFACSIGANKLFYAGSMNEHELTAYK
ncbi:outer membrane protein assembly factor BamB family protein [Aquimarina macrocephali]|uniref:outer membrane protein assembly factor BamB family protein n=1 Tax=Aquimarina macrocephali TaxID=666563 RepID=UPI0004646D64|nr:PQQ-binding-like beta-propeller repeat protein [Aquimarina macrocephali]